jgi:lipopolysaccharide assembly outer membrane protein LptD (OstA)
MNRTRAAVAAAGLLALLAIAPAAPPRSGSNGSGLAVFNNIAGFDHIATQDVKYNLNTGAFTLKEHFTAARSGTDISADSATGNSKTKQLHAEGHVVVHETRPPSRGRATSPLGNSPATMTCDKLDVDGVRKIYTATGNMHFEQEGGREASADKATLDDIRHMLHLEGHAHVRDKEQTMDADVLDYNTETGDVNGHGNVTISSPVETATPGLAAPPTARPAGKKRR